MLPCTVISILSPQETVMLFVRGESDAGVELWAGGTFDVEDGVGIGAVDETGTDVELDTLSIAADEKPFVNIYKEN